MGIRIIALTLFSFACFFVLFAGNVMAGPILPPPPPPPPVLPCIGPKCPIPIPLPPRPICLNVFCNYHRVPCTGGIGCEHNDGNKKFETCRTASQFIKLVSFDGRELFDRSFDRSNPTFEVECDHQIIFNNSAHRFTDEFGSRIQAEGGPFPATVLPRMALSEGHRYALSTLELEGQILQGHCFIYDGPRLMNY